MKLIKYGLMITILLGTSVQAAPYVTQGKTRFNDSTIRKTLKDADAEINKNLEEVEKDDAIQRECGEFIEHSVYWGDHWPHHSINIFNGSERTKGQRSLTRCFAAIDDRYKLDQANSLIEKGTTKINDGKKLSETNKEQGDKLISEGNEEIKAGKAIIQKINALKNKICPGFKEDSNKIPCDVYDLGQKI